MDSTNPAVYFFKSSLIYEVGNFDETLHLAMDYDFWLRISQKYQFHYIPYCLSVYRFHAASKSSLGDDWKHFYPEWHKVYSRYKLHSKLIGNTSKLLTIALPLPQEKLHTSSEYLSIVRNIISKIDCQIIKDLEILIVTDLEHADEVLGLDNLSIDVFLN